MVWQHSANTDLFTFQNLHSAVRGGMVRGIDLVERQVENNAIPILTRLTAWSATSTYFDRRGWVQKELTWTIPEPGKAHQAWLLPTDHLLVRFWQTKDTPDSLAIIDASGALLWEFSPQEPITSVQLDENRRRMVVGMPNKIAAYRLD
jgi:hypothetical protein